MGSFKPFHRCSNIAEAHAAFDQHGFCIIASGMSDQTLSSWDGFMQQCVHQLEAAPPDWQGYRGSGRHSFNVMSDSLANNHYYNCFRSLIDLHDLLARIHNCSPNATNEWKKGSYYVKSNGGDVCKAEEHKYQKLHSDWEEYPLHDCHYGIPLVASIALCNIPKSFAPIRIVSKDRFVVQTLPCDDQGSIWGHEYFACLEKGDILLRDCRVPHSGTPNTTLRNRCLPGIVILSPEWC